MVKHKPKSTNKKKRIQPDHLDKISEKSEEENVTSNSNRTQSDQKDGSASQIDSKSSLLNVKTKGKRKHGKSKKGN